MLRCCCCCLCAGGISLSFEVTLLQLFKQAYVLQNKNKFQYELA